MDRSTRLAVRRGKRTTDLSEDRYRELFDSAPDGLLVLEARTGRILDANPALERLTGCPRGALLRSVPWEVAPLADLAASPSAFRRLAARKTACRFERTLRDARGRLLEIEFTSAAGAGVVQWNLRRRSGASSEQARKGEASYRALFNNMNEGFAVHEILCDAAGRPMDYRFLDINPAFEQLTGLRRAQVIGRTHNQVLPHDSPRWVEEYGSVALGGRPIQFENYSPALKRHYYVSAYRPAPGQFAVTFSDVTELKRMEADLRVNLAKYTVLFDAFPLGITVSGPDGKIRETNREATRLLGIPEQEQLRRTLNGPEWRIIRPDGSEMPPGEYASVRALKERVRVENQEMGILKQDGQVTWISVSAAPLPEDSVVVTYGDITPRKRAEDENARRNAELEAVFSAQNDAVLVYDPGMFVRRVNPSFRKVYGFDPLGMNVREVIARVGCRWFDGRPMRLEDQPTPRALQGESVTGAVYSVTRADGSRAVVETSSGPMRVGEQIIGSVTVWHDVTDRISAQEALLRARADLEARVAERTGELNRSNARLRDEIEERQRLAQNLHDAVNQSLFSAGLIAEVLPHLWERDRPAATASLEDLRRLTRGAQAELRGLLAELKPSVLANADLGDLLRQLANAFTGRANIPVCIDAPAGPPLPAEVQVAFYRLCQEGLNNVAKHSGAHGVRIEVRRREGAVELSLSDDGCGFDSTRPAPAGHFGLGMMRERAAAVGARLTITSRPGRGTRIHVRWEPAAEEAVQP